MLGAQLQSDLQPACNSHFLHPPQRGHQPASWPVHSAAPAGVRSRLASAVASPALHRSRPASSKTCSDSSGQQTPAAVKISLAAHAMPVTIWPSRWHGISSLLIHLKIFPCRPAPFCSCHSLILPPPPPPPPRGSMAGSAICFQTSHTADTPSALLVHARSLTCYFAVVAEGNVGCCWAATLAANACQAHHVQVTKRSQTQSFRHKYRLRMANAGKNMSRGQRADPGCSCRMRLLVRPGSGVREAKEVYGIFSMYHIQPWLGIVMYIIPSPGVPACVAALFGQAPGRKPFESARCYNGRLVIQHRHSGKTFP